MFSFHVALSVCSYVGQISMKLESFQKDKNRNSLPVFLLLNFSIFHLKHKKKEYLPTTLFDFQLKSPCLILCEISHHIPQKDEHSVRTTNTKHNESNPFLWNRPMNIVHLLLLDSVLDLLCFPTLWCEIGVWLVDKPQVQFCIGGNNSLLILCTFVLICWPLLLLFLSFPALCGFSQ